MLSQSRLKDLLHYDSDTGVFTWAPHKPGEWPKSHAGKTAGCTKSERGYSCRVIRVDNRLYKAHHLAWLYVHGVMPTHQIDHIDGNAMNNAIENLRDCPQSTNMQNLRSARKDNKLGLLGVCERHDGKFIAQIAKGGFYKFIGVFDDPHVAHQAYLETKRKLHEGCTI